MATLLTTLAGLYFAALMALAALGDLRRLTISNRLVAGLAAGAPAWHIGVGTAALWPVALGALAVFAVGALVFARGHLGGGDVKLAAATALWLDPAALVDYLLLAALAGGALAALLLALPGLHARVGSARREAKPLDGRPAVPYGVALAMAGLAVLPWGTI